MADMKLTELDEDMRRYLLPRVKLMRPLTNEVRGRCWVWQLSLSHGYAQGCWGKKASPCFHLVVLKSVGRPRPHGLEADHLCCRRACLNPDHIEYVTKQENGTRMVNRGHHWASAKTHCKYGHEFTPENTLPNAYGKGRRCRTCHNEETKLAKRRKRATT